MKIVCNHIFDTQKWLGKAKIFFQHNIIGRQILRTTKLTSVLLTILLLQVRANGFTQTVTYSGKNVSLEKVFEAVKKQTGYRFFYAIEIWRNTKPVTIEVKNAPVIEVLKLALKNQPLSFIIENKTIIISKSEEQITYESASKITVQSPIDVTGKVVNENGEPVVASITVKGTTKGTTSDEDGNFYLPNVDANAVLIVSGVGIQPAEIELAGKKELLVKVKIEIGKLEETIIKGYYTTTKRLNTGNVIKISAETISKQPINNPLQALQGRVPGMTIVQNTGVPGGRFTVQVRGQNSLRNSADDNGNLPFYVIDGVPFTSLSINPVGIGAAGTISPLNSINPNDIESIEVLKDADATAIYGSRGSNGVILITTKKGKIGKPKVEVGFYGGIEELASKMDLLNTEQYLMMRKEAFKNDSRNPTISNAPDLLVWDSTRQTDWQKALIGGTAHITDVQSAISGGATNYQYLVGGNYHRQTTVFPGDFSDQKSSIHFSVNHQSINQKFRGSISGSYSLDNNNLLQSDLTFQALTLAPNAPEIYDSVGNLNWQNSTWSNPFSIVLQKYQGKTDNIIGNAVFSYEPFNGLLLKSSFGYTKMNLDEILTMPITSRNPALGVSTGSSTFANNHIQTWLIEPQLEYKVKIGKGGLSTLIGTTIQQSIKDGDVINGNGYVSDILLKNIKAAPNLTVSSVYYSEYRYNAIYGRFNYDWQNKYIINITGRRDGSSRFGPGKQFANFGALGIAWIFSDEEFVKRLSFVDYGKFRASYGTAGSDQITDYGFLPLYNSTTYPYQGNQGLYPNNLYNSDYGWETNKKYEVAIEVGLLKNRLSFSASYYHNRSSNQLVGYPLPAMTGFTSIQANLSNAVVQNTGIEIVLNTINLNYKEFVWSTNFNITIPRNKLVSYPDISLSSYKDIYDVGEPLTIKKVYEFVVVNEQSGILEFIDKDGNLTSNPSFTNDRLSVKNVGPIFYGGFQNSLRYKRFLLDVFFQFVRQEGLNYITGNLVPGRLGNQPVDVLRRWRKPGDNTDIQRFTQLASSNAYSAYSFASSDGSNRISDASFIRLKNISLSFQMPDLWSRKLGLQNGRIYLQGQNLITITNYLGLDPENQSRISLPPLRTLTAGLQITF